jgi:hypothetical protein
MSSPRNAANPPNATDRIAPPATSRFNRPMTPACFAVADGEARPKPGFRHHPQPTPTACSPVPCRTTVPASPIRPRTGRRRKQPHRTIIAPRNACRHAIGSDEPLIFRYLRTRPSPCPPATPITEDASWCKTGPAASAIITRHEKGPVMVDTRSNVPLRDQQVGTGAQQPGNGCFRSYWHTIPIASSTGGRNPYYTGKPAAARRTYLWTNPEKLAGPRGPNGADVCNVMTRSEWQ